jgi:mRNA-degrading endonuclease HigB of HigAB toxin-antitoxin module
MYAQVSTLVVPVHVTALNALAALSGGHDKIEVYSGNQAVENYGVSVQGSGAWAKGKIKGKITTYDYKALYQIYNLKDTESANYWFVSYSKSTSHDELKKTFESSKTVTTDYELEFEISGNDYGISSVFITYQVIRLQLAGQTKDFVVTNPPSSGASLPDGSKYPGGFKPIGA